MKALDNSAITDRCTLYEDLAWTLYKDRISDVSKPLKDEGNTKRKQAPQSEANVCRRRKCNLKKPPLLIAQDTQ